MTIRFRLSACAVLACIAVTPAAFARGGHGGGHSGSHSGYHFGSRGSGEHMVSGYTRKNGTYVAPHYQTNANGTRNDNYSTRGNVNPHTGEEGTKPRDGEASPQ